MDVKRTIGQFGPRTEEKCKSNGARLLRGRSSMMAATFLECCLLVGNDEKLRGVQVDSEGGEKADRRK